jgi:nucleotide-binding universal stress UspA family protein
MAVQEPIGVELVGVAIRNLAVATDFSKYSERAVQHALAIARHFGATLHFLHIVRPSEFRFTPDIIPHLEELACRDCNRMIDSLVVSHRLDNIEHHGWAIKGEVSDILGNFVRDRHIDLLVLGTRGRGALPRFLLGSVAQEMFHHVECPVLTVGPWSPGASTQLQLKRVLFSSDLSCESAAAIPYVLTATRKWHTELDVVHVCSSADSDCKRQMNSLIEKMQDMLGESERPPTHIQMLKGRPSSSVIDFANRNKEDLIVLGLKPRRAVYNGPFWSHAYEVVRQAQCPVLSVRSTPLSMSDG